MTEYTPPPIGVSVRIPFTAYVSNVKNGVVTLTLRNGDTLPMVEPTWEYAEPDWLPARFGDIVECVDGTHEHDRYLYIGSRWVDQKTGEIVDLTADEIARCRLLSRSS